MLHFRALPFPGEVPTASESAQRALQHVMSSPWGERVLLT